MLRITLWTVIKTILAISLLLSISLPPIWLALPSPTVQADERAAYIQDTLSAGQVLVAAWDIKALTRTDKQAFEEYKCVECTSVLFHWQFIRIYNKPHIIFAPHLPNVYGALDRPFALVDELKSANEWNGYSAKSQNPWCPKFLSPWGPPTWPNIVPAALKDEHISWDRFHDVDRHLIHYKFLQRTTDIDIRPVIPMPGVVEFWRGAAIDRAFHDTSDGWADLLNKPDVMMDAGRTPAIYAQLRKHEIDDDLVASFEFNGTDVEDIIVRELKGGLPSRTWHLRKQIITMFTQHIVGPILFVKDAERLLAPHISEILLFFVVFIPVYFGTILCFWIAAGCPNIFKWTAGFHLTKHFVPKRWSGKIQDQPIR